MLTLIKKIFSKTTTTEDIPPRRIETHTSYRVTDSMKIIHVLNSIGTEAAFCTIKLNNSNETYTSHIIEIQSTKKQLLLDELTPSSGNELLKQCHELKLTTYLNNIYLSITLNNISELTTRRENYFTAPFPKYIDYPQRRSSSRVAITMYNLFFQGSSNRINSIVKGIVYDLSRNGLGLIVNSTKTKLIYDDQLKNCTLILPNKINIHFDLHVRSVRPYSNSQTKSLIGGSFNTTTSIKERDQLEHFFALAERSQIRKKKKNY